MPLAIRAARTLCATTRGQRGAGHSVYTILLHDGRRGGRWGLYVGQTGRDPDRRFGACLLPDLVAHLNPLRGWEAHELEAALASAFRVAGAPRVEGGH